MQYVYIQIWNFIIMVMGIQINKIYIVLTRKTLVKQNLKIGQYLFEQVEDNFQLSKAIGININYKIMHNEIKLRLSVENYEYYNQGQPDQTTYYYSGGYFK